MQAGKLSSENGNAGRRRCHPNRKATRRRAISQVRRGPAESKTPRMYRSSTRENRETPVAARVRRKRGPVGESDER
jgi:hypothetical protein